MEASSGSLSVSHTPLEVSLLVRLDIGVDRTAARLRDRSEVLLVGAEALLPASLLTAARELLAIRRAGRRAVEDVPNGVLKLGIRVDGVRRARNECEQLEGVVLTSLEESHMNIYIFEFDVLQTDVCNLVLYIILVSVC